MVLFKMVFRKMIKNKWLVFCMAFGLIISTSLISSIPIYKQAVLQKFLISDLENYQKKNQEFTGGYLITSFVDTNTIIGRVNKLGNDKKNPLMDVKVQDFFKKTYEAFKNEDSYITKGNVERNMGIPTLAKVYNYSTNKWQVHTPSSAFSQKSYYAGLESMSNLQNHIKLLDGRMPAEKAVDGVYEVLLNEQELKDLKIILGQTLTLKYSDKNWGLPEVKVKPVGVFTVKDLEDPYWTFIKPERFNESLMIDENLLKEDFLEKYPPLFSGARWYYAFNYHALTVNDLGNTLTGNINIEKELNGLTYNQSFGIKAPVIEIMNTYLEKSKQLTKMLWVLNVPLIIMLLLYLFMISKVIISRERNEISLLTSRGSTRIQIVFGYLAQYLLLGGLAFFIGPLIGMNITKFIGASDGFLQFAMRKGLFVQLNADAFVYAIMAIVVSLITILIPAYISGGTDIVDLKRKISRGTGVSSWERVFLDFILIAISIYGYYNFIQRQKVLETTGIQGIDMQIDPMLFLVPSIFIIGTGLLALRVYPLIVKVIYLLGKGFWKPSMYVTLTQVGRSFKSYHFLMIFLIMTISVGIFSAVSARTISLNEKEKIYYSAGADISLTAQWDTDKSSNAGYPAQPSTSMQTIDTIEPIQTVQYSEPPFTPYTQLSGVLDAAKVLKKDNATVGEDGKIIEGVDLMGIEPYDFGKVAWFRSGLLDHHINEYLNLLAEEPSACIISESLNTQYNVRVGDTISISYSGKKEALFTVYGIVDYWPSWNPNKNPQNKDKDAPLLIVTNLKYIQDHITIEPYDIWIKLKEGTTSKQFYDSILQKKLNVTNITDVNQKLIDLKNNPFQLAINGVMTLGFLISGVICFFGFLLYWTLSIRSRTLQYGVFRAMGLSTVNLLSMMVWEQILTSGAAIAIGMFTGAFTSRLFSPFFQVCFDAYSQVPPFRVVYYAEDRMKIYIIIGFTLGVGITVLSIILSRIKIDQAIKLGED